MQRRLQQSTSRWSTTAPRREPESLKAATVRKSRLASQCAFWTILGAQAICLMLFLNAWAESGSVNAEVSAKRHGRPASQWELLPGVGPWLLLLTAAWNGLYLYTWRSSPGYVDASRAPKMPAPSITDDGTFAAPTAAATAAHASSVCPADSVGSAPGPTIPTPRTSGSDRHTPPDDTANGPSSGAHQAAGQQDPQTATAAVTMPVNRGHRFRTSGVETHHQAQAAAAAPQYQQHASSPARPRGQRRQNSAPASTLGNDIHHGGDQASAAKVAADDRSLSSHRTQPELDYSSGDTFIVHSSRESPAPLLGRSDGWSTPQDASRLGRIEDSPGKFTTHWRGFSTESFPRIAHGLYNTAVSGESDVTASAPGSLQTTSPQMAAVLPAAAVPHPHAGVLPQALLPHLAASGTAVRRPLPNGAPPHAPGPTCAAAPPAAPVSVGQQSKAVGHDVARMVREQAEQDQQSSASVEKTTGGGGDMHGFTDPATALRYCGVCFQWQPMRSKHCALCGKCVLRYDHHCFWVGTCVGQHNQGRFVLMLIVLVPWMVSALHAASLNTSLLSRSWTSLVVSIILAIFAALMCGFGGALLAFHAYLVATGQTTFEVCKTPSPSYVRLHASRLKRGAQTAASTPSSSSMRSATPGALTPETAIPIPATYDAEDGADGGNGGSLLHRRGEDNGLSKDDAAFASVASSASGVRPAALSWWVRARLAARHPRLFFTNRISGAVSLFRGRLGSHDHPEGSRLLSQGPPGEGPCGAMTSGPFDRGVVKNTAEFFFGDPEMLWRLPQSPAGCV